MSAFNVMRMTTTTLKDLICCSVVQVSKIIPVKNHAFRQETRFHGLSISAAMRPIPDPARCHRPGPARGQARRDPAGTRGNPVAPRPEGRSMAGEHARLARDVRGRDRRPGRARGRGRPARDTVGTKSLLAVRGRAEEAGWSRGIVSWARSGKTVPCMAWFEGYGYSHDDQGSWLVCCRSCPSTDSA